VTTVPTGQVTTRFDLDGGISPVALIDRTRYAARSFVVRVFRFKTGVNGQAVTISVCSAAQLERGCPVADLKWK